MTQHAPSSIEIRPSSNPKVQPISGDELIVELIGTAWDLGLSNQEAAKVALNIYAKRENTLLKCRAKESLEDKAREEQRIDKWIKEKKQWIQ